MDITPLGHASFRLRCKQATLVTDPYDSAMVGLKFPKHTHADIVTISHNHHDHDFVGIIEGSPRVLSGPGEYEVKGVSVVGIKTFHDNKNGEERGSNTVYRISMDGVVLVHLGDLGHDLTSSVIDELDGVDVLFVPVGGVYTIGSREAVNVIKEIEPSVVIPMHYKRPGMAATFSQLVGVDTFISELGQSPVAPVSKLSITKDKIPIQMQVVVLE